MKDDLISRRAAIAEFSCCELTPDGGIDANDAIKILEQLPSAQPGWIPTSERLPDNDRAVLVTLKWAEDDYEVAVGEYWHNSTASHGWGSFEGHVIAWHELPTPYREGGTGMILVGALCFLIGGVVGVVLSAVMMASGRWDREKPHYKPEYKVVVQKPGVKVVGAAMTIDRYSIVKDPEGMERLVKGRLAELMAEKLMDMIDIKQCDNPATNSVECMAQIKVLDPDFKF